MPSVLASVSAAAVPQGVRDTGAAPVEAAVSATADVAGADVAGAEVVPLLPCADPQAASVAMVSARPTQRTGVARPSRSVERPSRNARWASLRV